MLKFNKSEPLNRRRNLVNHPTNLFDFVPINHLNRRLPPSNHQISIDAFQGMEACSLVKLGCKNFKKTFISPLHQVECYGLILYLPNSINLDDEMQDNEFNILIHNCSTLAYILFGENVFSGSHSLLLVYFLFILKQCEKFEKEIYIQKCIKFTIERLCNILKCKLLIFPGMEPNMDILMKYAFIFNTKILPKSKENSETYNIIRKMSSGSIQFLNLTKEIFNLNYEHEDKVYQWLFWNFMCNCVIPIHQRIDYFKVIVLTKKQNWMKLNITNVKNKEKVIDVILLEGANNGKPYLECQEHLSIHEMFQLIALYEKNQRSPKATQNLNDLSKIKIYDNEIPKLVESIVTPKCFFKCKHFCKTTGKLPIICPLTNLLASDCYETQKFNFDDYNFPAKANYGHSYIRVFNNFIFQNSKDDMSLPNLNEFLQNIVNRSPICVHTNYKELCEIYKHIHTMFKELKDMFETSSSEDLSKNLKVLPENLRTRDSWRYLWHSEYWLEEFKNIKNEGKNIPCECCGKMNNKK